MVVWAFLVAGLAVRAFADGLLGGRGRSDDPVIVPATIDLNRDGLDGLQALPGIGAARAEAIILDRVRRGPFHAIEDLDRVDGIGSATIGALRPFVSTDRPVPTPVAR